MARYGPCQHCGQVKTWHGPECMEEWLAWARNQTVPSPGPNQHVVWATIGRPGAGKSGFNECLAVNLDVGDFDVRRQVVFRPADRKPVAQSLGKRKVILDDESTQEGGHKRRAMSKENVGNVMDLDAMRGRNQYTGFTAPEFDHLDPDIQEAVMWVFECHHDGRMTAYSMEHRGKPGNRFHYLTERFQDPKFPHASVHYPEKWAEMLAVKEDFMRGRGQLAAARLQVFEDRAETVFEGLLKTVRGSGKQSKK